LFLHLIHLEELPLLKMVINLKIFLLNYLYSLKFLMDFLHYLIEYFFTKERLQPQQKVLLSHACFLSSWVIKILLSFLYQTYSSWWFISVTDSWQPTFLNQLTQYLIAFAFFAA
jgi:hypothetical protein